MRLGIDDLVRAVKGLRVGAILNPTSVTPDLRHMADVLAGVPGVHLVHLGSSGELPADLSAP